MRAPGLHVPGNWSGTFRRDGGAAFWNVVSGGQIVAIELSDEHVDRRYLTVPDPRETVDMINSAVQC